MVHDGVCALVGRHRSVGGGGKDNVIGGHGKTAADDCAFLEILGLPRCGILGLFPYNNSFAYAVFLSADSHPFSL